MDMEETHYEKMQASDSAPLVKKCTSRIFPQAMQVTPRLI